MDLRAFWKRKSIIHSLQIISTKSLLHVILVSRTHSGCSSKLSPNFLLAPMYNNIFLLCLLSSREILSSVPVGRYSLSVLPLFVLAGQYKSEHNKFASPRLAPPRLASPRPASRESSPRGYSSRVSGVQLIRRLFIKLETPEKRAFF